MDLYPQEILIGGGGWDPQQDGFCVIDPERWTDNENEIHLWQEMQKSEGS